MLKMRVDAQAVRVEMADIPARQVPYATALGLTKLAQRVQQGIQRDVLPSHFTLRRAAWAKSGIRVTPATKDNLQSRVTDINPYMGLQETGGEKIPYGTVIAVPLSGARPNVRALIAAQDLPHAVMERGGFIRGNVMYAVALKQGRRGRLSKQIGGITKAATWERKIVPMYALVPRAEIKKRYGFVDKARDVVQRDAQQVMNEAIARAVRTARKS